MSGARKPLFRKLTQVAMVVRDVEATARRYWEDLGIGPWKFYTLDPSNTPSTLRGKPVTHAFRAALATIGDVGLELIQPLEGESLYAEHLARRGEGLHHLAFQVEDFAAARAALSAKGYAEIQSGRPFGVTTYVYFDTDERLGFLTELGSGGDKGKGLPEAEFILPGD